MTNRYVDTLLPLFVIVIISFAVAWGLFRLMESSATVNSSWYQLGGGIAGFVVVFMMLRSLYKHLDARRSEDLAIEIARLTAANIVKEGGDDIAALNTAYSDTRYQLCDYFKRQDKQWLKVLLAEFLTETIRQARQQYPSLREWQPKEVVYDTVVENIEVS